MNYTEENLERVATQIIHDLDYMRHKWTIKKGVSIELNFDNKYTLEFFPKMRQLNMNGIGCLSFLPCKSYENLISSTVSLLNRIRESEIQKEMSDKIDVLSKKFPQCFEY